MESTESSYLSSPEPHRNRSPPPPKSPTSDNMEKPTYIRFLVSNAAAGSVIGKGGATITEFQSQSGARIQLSRNYEFFPGTSDRIIGISGLIDDVLKAVELVLAKLLSELHTEDGHDTEPRMKVRLIVPNNSCGSIIGKGGAIIKFSGDEGLAALSFEAFSIFGFMPVGKNAFANSRVKSFIEESQASIKISPMDKNFYGLNDRVVTVAGTLEEQMQAIDLILSKLSEDPHYAQAMNTPFSYSGVYFSGFHGIPCTYVLPSVATAAYNTMGYAPNGTGVKFQNNKEDHTNSVTIGVADEHIGLVVGRSGRNIMEISQVSGARIKISDRGDFLSGTTDRKVTITGSQRSVRAAEGMIMQKVAYASQRGTD